MNQPDYSNKSLNRVNDAAASLKAGGGIIIIDDDKRENEGDIVFPAQSISAEQMALMINHCSGIVCLCITAEKAAKLSLPLMVSDNTSRFKTAFTVSIEASEGVTTGVSAHDRVTTIRAAVADNAGPEDLNRPGHVFPLIARENGVLERQGHTEATVDIMKIAGLKPCGILCELMNRDGSMAKGSQITYFSKRHKYPILFVEDIIYYRKHNF